ncbi:MAG: hypothetical protein IMY73_01085 [Bacteroidetes bacterium]|nr:hypothetical protein [Bacteroidota bacterium]
MRKIFLVLFSIIAFAISPAKGQSYHYSAGLTIGPAVGINVSAFLTTTSSIETSVSYNTIHDAPMVTALYRYHMSIIDDLDFYGGGGVNMGAYNLGHHADTKFAIGIDPVVGFEYAFPDIPLAIAIDYKPTINLSCKSMWEEVGLKVKYLF